MLTLAVDTTAEFGSIALLEDEEIREEALIHAPEGFSGILFAQIDALLAAQGVSLNQIELFAGASGPGSFTGVRIGLAAVKGLGEVLGRPVIAISNLQALADIGSALLRVPVIDARRGEVYAGIFNHVGVAVFPESVLAFPRLLELLAGRNFEWISSHFEPFRATLAGSRFEGIHVVNAPRAMAPIIARMALRTLRTGASGDPATIEANYVRRPDAELFWKG